MKETSVVVPLIVVGALGAVFGFCAGLEVQESHLTELRRKAVAAHAAYWKHDPGTGKPVLVWVSGEDR